MKNAIGIISMQYRRPFGVEHFDQFARWKAAGYDFVELLVPDPGEMDLPLLRRALDDAGLFAVITARVNRERSLTADDGAVRQKGYDYLLYCLDVAKTLGVAIIGGPLYGSPLVFAGLAPHPVSEDLRQRRIDWCVSSLTSLGDEAAKAGLRLAIEPLNRYETDFVNTVRQGVELVAMVDRPSVGLTLDTFHMNMEEDDLCEAIGFAGRHLMHFQANENHRGYLGTGHVHWTSVVRALGAAGYDGTITLEPFRRRDDRIGVPFAQWRQPLHDEQAEYTASCTMIRALIDLNGSRK
ncbi:sugar phosphate isomerase/epimerase family protein [Telmatospirillum sp.]|uniref:sugar phosphate isomerase/epimerase family protein n=1 Tax=Telmatospirillum sp. TaxID=2079197 RepID=UPI0028436A89|nr:sugar phosphate isomerase/epimerase family protein [Telmatospirillum sp.]MDR3438667.1 sugar phosphate isomerase/epimerase [Telmatospirillum sp.]